METKWDGRRMDTVNCVIVRLIMAAFKCKSGEGGLGDWGGGVRPVAVCFCIK